MSPVWWRMSWLYACDDPGPLGDDSSPSQHDRSCVGGKARAHRNQRLRCAIIAGVMASQALRSSLLGCDGLPRCGFRRALKLTSRTTLPKPRQPKRALQQVCSLKDGSVMQNLSILSPLLSVHKRLKAVEADTPFGSLFKVLLPGPLVSMSTYCLSPQTTSDARQQDTETDARQLVVAMLLNCRKGPAPYCTGIHACAAHASQLLPGWLGSGVRTALGGPSARLHHQLRCAGHYNIQHVHVSCMACSLNVEIRM